MTRKQAIFAAGVITSIVLVAILGLNVDRLRAGGQVSAAPAPAVPADVASAPEVQALLQQQQELEDAIRLMEEREAGYTEQLNEAQQTIDNLKATVTELETEAETDSTTISQYELDLAAANATVADLQGTAGILWEREAEYAAQIESLNQIILALQARVQQIAGR